MKQQGSSVVDRVGVDPIQKVRDSSVNSRKSRLGAFVAERNDSDLRPRVVRFQQKWTARVALSNFKLNFISSNQTR